MNLIAKHLSCHVQMKWDKASAATSNTDPTNSKIRPDVIFYININSKQLEIGNGEIKRRTASKKEVDEARSRMIGVCKRQLRLKYAGTTDDFVIFGVLIHGLQYEFFVVSYVDVYYPFEKLAWGEFASSADSFKTLERTFQSFLRLKKSMKQLG
ncbi:hypothetical protein RMATCC62417_10900 [Rhizopus microsporus]|nr:hypothetical protein RMATCC62417_10900 [Rhizopus microsporus]